MDISIAIDPGYQGSIGILVGNAGVVYDTPIRKIKTTRKTAKGNAKIKTEYAVDEMVGILKPFAFNEAEPVVSLEDVNAMTGEGVTSSFNFGEGKGIWIGICASLFGHKPHLVRATTWKKDYPEITGCSEIVAYKAEQKDLRIQLKDIPVKGKRLSTKEKELKKSINKEISSIGRKIKYIEKQRARELAAMLYPDISNLFKRVKDSDRAEALLIARWTQRRRDELV